MTMIIFVVSARGVHSGHWVIFGSDVSGRFKIVSCVHVDFYLFYIHFEVGFGSKVG